MAWTEAQIDAATEAARRARHPMGITATWREIAIAVLATVEPQRPPVDIWRVDVERRLKALEVATFAPSMRELISGSSE